MSPYAVSSFGISILKINLQLSDTWLFNDHTYVSIRSVEIFEPIGRENSQFVDVEIVNNLNNFMDYGWKLMMDINCL